MPRPAVSSRKRSRSILSRLLASEQLEPRALLAGLTADSTFDHDGLVITDTTHAVGSEDILYAIDSVAGNKQWAAGRAQTGSGFVGAVTRLNADGSADTTFGSGGRLISSLFFEFTDVKGLSDGGAVVTGFVNGPDASHDFGLLKLLADGTPDPNFGTRGLATADFGGTSDKPYSIAVLSGGSFIVAGDSAQDFAVAKFDAQGNLDTSFNNDGLHLIDIDGFDDHAAEVEVDGTGRVVIAGRGYDGVDDNFAVVRLSSSGAPDNSFGTAGIVRTDFANAGRDEEGISLEIQSGNNIVVGGYTVDASGDRDFALARYSATNGSLLAGFGTGGQVVIDFNRNATASDDEIAEIKLDSSGRIVALGTAEDSSPAVDMAVVVLNGATGALDTSFDENTGGRLYFDFFAYTENEGAALDIDSTGRWIAGSSAGKFQPNFGITSVNGSTGVVDTSFGNNGRAAYDFSDQQGRNDDARGVALLSDGSAIVVGQTSFQKGTVFKLNPSGELDDTFAQDGKLLAELFYQLDDVAVLADGSIVAVGLVFGPTADLDLAVLKLLPSGALDNSFGQRGVASAGDFSGGEVAEGIAVQADGKIVVVGTANADSDTDFAIARFDALGNLDSTFDSDGRQTVSFGNVSDRAYDVAVDGSNRIVVAGSTINASGNSDFALARLTAGGGFDTGFGGTGKVQTDFGAANRDEVAYSLVIQAGNAIVAAGFHDSDDFDRDFAVARYGSNGSLLAGFGTNGQATIDFTTGATDSDDEAREVRLDSSGRLVLAGTTHENTTFLPRQEIAQVVLSGTTGQIVPSFNVDTGGRLSPSVFTYYPTRANALAMAIDSSDRWVTVGSTSDYNIAVLRQNGSTGVLDAAYGNGGRVIVDGTDLTGDSDVVRGVALDSPGRTVLAGLSSGTGWITRLTPAGELDLTFGVQGVAATEAGFFSDVAVLPSGKILAAGGGSSADFFLMKFNADGSVDRSFGNKGVALADFGGNATAFSMAVQSNGSIVLAGDYNNDFAVARFTSDGNLDSTFSGDGMQTIDFLGFTDSASRVKIDSQNRIVIAGQAADGSDDDFALARLTSTGNPDNSFGSQGKVRTDFGGANRFDAARSLVIQAGDTIVAGGSTNDASGNGDFALARYGVNGGAQAGFGINGQVVLDFAAGLDSSDDDISDLQLDAEGRLIAFGTSFSLTSFDAPSAFAVAAFDGVTGAIDTSVDPDTGGRVLIYFYASNGHSGKDLEIDATGHAVFAGYVHFGDGNIAAARFSLGNSAPVLDNSVQPSLNTISEDVTSPPGTLVSTFAAARITDADGDPEGIAVIGLTEKLHGTWQYSTNGGASWLPLGNPSETSARLLAPNHRVRFIPQANYNSIPTSEYNGTPQLKFRAWDQSDGLTAGSITSTSGNLGGNNAFSLNSVSAKLTITPVNDAPVLNTSSPAVLNYVVEDAPNPLGTQVNAFAGAKISDVDSGALKGIAVIGLTEKVNGTWQFSTNGGNTWQNLGNPSDTAARLLNSENRVRFKPNANYNGNPQLFFRAWDRSDGLAAGTVVNTTGRRGGTGSISTAQLSAQLPVTSVNDAPVLTTSSNPQLNPIQENATNPLGTLVSNFANPKITDADAGAQRGIAVVGLTEKINGTWQFSTNDGASWTNLGSPTDTAARVLAANSRVRFIPNANYQGTPQLILRAWDRTDGVAVGSVVNTDGKRGGSGAYSSASLGAQQSINDKPEIILSGSIGYVRGAPAVTLAPNAALADADSANFAGGDLRVSILTGGGNNNTLAIGGTFTVDGSNNVKINGITIGTRVSNGVGTNELRINFNTNATKSVVQQLVRSITYRNVGGSAGQRGIAITVSDGDGGLSDARTKTVNVT